MALSGQTQFEMGVRVRGCRGRRQSDRDLAGTEVQGAAGQPQLILRERTKTDDHELSAEAWKAANDKARELGWIV